MDGGGGCQGHSHDHDHDDARGVSLRKYYDLDGVICLNEQIVGSGRQMVAKFYEDRLNNDNDKLVMSPPDDPELLLTIPFTEAVTIHYITIRGSNPHRIKLFCNRNDLDFDMARDMPGMMELELLPSDHISASMLQPDGNNNDGTVDYPLRPAGRFRNIDSLTIFFMDNYDTTNDDDNEGTSTEISYVGLKGVGSGIQRRPVVEAVYESQGMPKDHKVKGGGFESHSMVS